MTFVEYLPMIAMDPATGETGRALAGRQVTIVDAATGEPVQNLAEVLSRVPVSNPVTVGADGYTPWVGAEDGPTLVRAVSGGFSTPVWSPSGMEAKAEAARQEAVEARQAAERAASGATVPTDEAVATIFADESSATRGVIDSLGGLGGSTAWPDIPQKPAQGTLLGDGDGIVVDEDEAAGTTTVRAAVRLSQASLDERYQSPTVVGDGETTEVVEDAEAGTATVHVTGRLEQAALDAAYLPFTASLPWLAQPASYLQIEDKLAKWWAALATGTAQAAIITNSIGEGLGASDPRLRWQTVVQRALSPDGPLFPFIPADPGMSVETNWPVVRSGSLGSASNWGLGWRTVTIGSTGRVEWTFTGDRCGLMYVVGPSAGSIDLTIDGGAPVFIDGLSSASNPASNAAVWDSGPLTDGVHTVVATRASTSAISPYVEGLLTYRGDYTTGVRILDAAHSGINSTYFTSGRITNGAQALQGAGGVDLVVIGVGTNDYAAGIAPATYRANIEALIAGIRARGMDPSFVLQNVYMAADRSDATYRQYGEQLRAIAAGDPDVAYFDLRRRMPDVPTPYTAPAGLGLFADPVHPSDAGHAWIGRAMTDYLSLRA